MSLTTYFSFRKLRRSQRLESKEKLDLSIINEGELGFFNLLPSEIIHTLFTYLTVEDLSILSITSKAMRDIVESYRISKAAVRKFFPENLSHAPLSKEQQEECLKGFQKLGILMKRSTCLYSTQERLKQMEDFLKRLECIRVSKCNCLNKCIALNCYGKFIHTVIAGWDESEYYKVYEAIENSSKIWKAVHIILNSAPGFYKWAELAVRFFYRRVFLDQCATVTERAFWISRILKPWPMIHQAKLLFILYGPVYQEEVQWFEVTECIPVNCQQASEHFLELAKAIQIIQYYKREWSDDDICGIVEDITGLPDEWLPENIATLLYLCGDLTSILYLGNKALNGRMLEIGHLITSFSLVCKKYGEKQTFVNNLLIQVRKLITNKNDKVQLMNSITDSFREVILDLHEFSDLDEDREIEFRLILDAQAEFYRLILSYVSVD